VSDHSVGTGGNQTQFDHQQMNTIRWPDFVASTARVDHDISKKVVNFMLASALL
jgi:hypothetical protein